MLVFYPRFIRTFDDLPGYVSLLIHCWSGCNMRCFGCHNAAELIDAKPDSRHLTAAQVLERLREGHQLFDALLLSGGEFLMNDMTEIRSFLKRVKALFAGPIVVYTNGTFPRKMQCLLDEGLIDGVHLDMKLPYHCLDPVEDAEVYRAIIGIAPSREYCQAMLESVEAVIRHDSKVSQIRTVRYPLLSEEYFEHIRLYVNELNIRHGSTVPYYLNPYYPPQPANA
jgi:pyruvate-formate lyase-activating enzyme